MNWFLVYRFAYFGIAIYMVSLLAAGILEALYESAFKKFAPQSFIKRLLAADNKIDQSVMKISDKYVYLTEYKGIIIGLLIVFVYFAGTYLLLHR
jgi:hypothetical protein